MVNGVLDTRSLANVISSNLTGGTVSLVECRKVDDIYCIQFIVILLVIKLTCKAASLIRSELYDSHIKIFAKIESLESLKNLEDIIEAPDGVMVARGDLGVQIPLEQIPAIQESIIKLCRHLNKPVIVASQLLESMVEYPTPTRAEVITTTTSKDACLKHVYCFIYIIFSWFLTDDFSALVLFLHS
jgi:hypothetical protein